MASGGGEQRPPPLARSLMDPSNSPRVKAVLIALTGWSDVRHLLLRAHDLVSVANLNRIELPDGLYRTFDTIRRFEHRFATLLGRLAQLPDPIHIVCFAKTFSERIFHAGETLETTLSPNLSAAANQRMLYRHLLSDFERALGENEAMVYASISNSRYGRSKIQKIFLPKPHPLEYIPPTLEPYLHSSPSSNSEPRPEFSLPLMFLCNRRAQLVELQQAMVATHSPEFTTLDTRDYHHELELLESEISLITALQRILSNTRMMEETEAVVTARVPDDSGSLTDTLREAVELVNSVRPADYGLAGIAVQAMQTPLRNKRFGEFSDRDIRNIETFSDELFSYAAASADIKRYLQSNHSQSRPISSLGPFMPPPAHSFVGEVNRIRNPTSNRGRWFPDPIESLDLEDIGEDPRNIAGYMGQNPDNFDVRNPNASAFIRVPRSNSSNPPGSSSLRSRASSVADIVDFGRNRNNDNESSVSGTGTPASRNHLANFEDRQNLVLQDIVNRLSRLEINARANSDILNRHLGGVADIKDSLQEISRKIGEVSRDVAVMKTKMNATFGFEPVLNGRDDAWRTIENSMGPCVRRDHNLSSRGWEGGDRTASSSVPDVASRGSERYNFTASASADRDIGGGYELNNGSSSHFLLNNQMPPGNRANNYWDNFKSYSRLNLLSEPKPNAPRLSSPAAYDVHHISNSRSSPYDASPSTPRHEPRGERSNSSAAMRASLSSNFVENIGQKKRNKDQKKQLSSGTSNSPVNSGSSNSSTTGSLNEAMMRSARISNVDSSHEQQLRAFGSTRDIGNVATLLENSGTRESLSSSGLSRPTRITRREVPNASPSCLEVDVVSRDEFLQLNSGAGSSSSGNGRSDDGEPSSTSSKRELEKLLPPENERRSNRREVNNAWISGSLDDGLVNNSWTSADLEESVGSGSKDDNNSIQEIDGYKEEEHVGRRDVQQYQAMDRAPAPAQEGEQEPARTRGAANPEDDVFFPM